jgi:hypothetical protein
MYRVSLFTVTESGTVETKLGMTDSPYYWRGQMELSRQLAEHPNGLQMRIIAQIEKDSYIKEFSAR